VQERRQKRLKYKKAGKMPYCTTRLSYRRETMEGGLEVRWIYQEVRWQATKRQKISGSGRTLSHWTGETTRVMRRRLKEGKRKTKYEFGGREVEGCWKEGARESEVEE
jgi:hypothetical protein